MSWLLPESNEKRANRFEDLASGLDAGLRADEVLGVGRAGDDACAVLEAADTRLTEVERRAFEAAIRAGELPHALRSRATALRSVGSAWRVFARATAYPLFVLGAAFVLIGWLWSLGFTPSIAPLVTLGALVVALLFVSWNVRRAHRITEVPLLLRPVGGLLRDYATIPYLDALRSLYESGVPILEAQRTAAAVAPIGALRAVLLRTATHIETNRGTLADALRAHDALDGETVRILASAESGGDLGDGLRRAIERRRDVCERGLRRTATWLGGVVYVVVALTVAVVVVGFYSALYRHA